MNFKLIEYDHVFAHYTKDIAIYAECNKIYFLNTGKEPIIINDNYIIAANTTNTQNSLELPGHIFEWDKTQYRIKFSSLDTSPGCSVIRKIYKNIPEVERLLNELTKKFGK
jgi:hypothetical protein